MPLRAVLRFGLYLLVGVIALSLAFVQNGLVTPWTRANVGATAAVARLMLPEARAEGTMLASGPARLDVRTGCNGVHAVLIFAAAVLACPAPWSRRLLGLVLGAVALFSVNILRLISLLLVAVHLPARVEFFHIYVWQTLMALLAFVMLLAWGTLFAEK